MSIPFTGFSPDPPTPPPPAPGPSNLVMVAVEGEQGIPVAVAKCDPAYGPIGAVVKVDGRLSTDPNNSDLTYTWSFDSVPIGSRVAGEDFRLIDEDGAVVSFSPDVVGEYVIGLVVSNGSFESPKAQAVSSIRSILVPHGRGIIPDGKWIWSYIRDVWQGVDNREMFETLWSALIQIAGAELLKLYEVDFNKSIRDIQDLYQRRWLSYEPSLVIKENGPDFFLGNHYAGNDASTINLGLSGLVAIVGPAEFIIVEGSLLQNVNGEELTVTESLDSTNDRDYTLQGLNPTKNGYKAVLSDTVPSPTADRIDSAVEFIFDANSTTWDGTPTAQVGDIVYYRTGLNKGFYRITAIDGSSVTVDRPSPSFSNVTTNVTHKAEIFRPVKFSITQPDSLLTNTVAIPFDEDRDISELAAGRVIVINGQTHTIVRASLDERQREPSVIITIDRSILQSGLSSLTWRTPPTLVSTTQDFEEDGVSPGDVIYFTVVQNGQESSKLPCQVIGVDRGRLGFVFTDQTVTAGEVPEIPNDFYLQLAEDFGIDGVTENSDGTMTFTDTAAEYIQTINSGLFQDSYWNTQLTPDTDISINPNFQIKPETILRNRLIPIDDELRSIPLLQNFITQPTVVERDGEFFQQHKGQEFKVDSPPVFLKENISYIVDSDYAFKGELTFETGSSIVEADDGDFIDRGVSPGDQFIISEPVTLARTYYVQAVLSPTQLKLTREIPLYPINDFVTADVKIRRGRDGHFIRFIPGQFTAASPAPKRLWAEVSFFDNNENVENNFGILVGLTRDDIALVSEDMNYRQAVAGIMYAYLNGPAIDKVRLGAHILLGLPFSENRGIIRSIENDYRLDINGDPVLGRLLIEDIDNVDHPLGTLRVYTFPIEEGSELAGLESSPVTEETYKVGDIVEKFAALSKGVEVSDYLSNPIDLETFSIERILQQYHSIRVRVNDDIFTLAEIGLVSSFLKKITPSYISFFISTVSEFFDDVNVQDDIGLSISVGGVDGEGLVDNASFSIPPALMFNSRNFNNIPQMLFGDGVYYVRRSGQDASTTSLGDIATIGGGGVLNPRDNEDFEAPLTRIGDKLLILQGLDYGLYDIIAVTDTAVEVEQDGDTVKFVDGENLRYAILRRVNSFIQSGATASYTNGSATVILDGGLRTNGVGPGDWLINVDATGPRSRFTIRLVKESSPDSGVWDRVEVVPTPEMTDTGAWHVVRPSIIEGTLSDGVYNIDGDGSNLITFDDRTLNGLADIGDEILIYNNTLSRHYILGPEQGYVTPPLANGSFTGTLVKNNRPSSGIGWDHISLFDPYDTVDVGIGASSGAAACTSTSDQVNLVADIADLDPLNILPGDLLKLNGANGGVDVGYGDGLYPILSIEDNTKVNLLVDLTNTESVPWSIVRRR